MRLGRGGSGGGCVEFGWVVDGETDGELEVGRVPEAGLDSARVGRYVGSISWGWEDGGVNVEVSGVGELLLKGLGGSEMRWAKE
jgi:hypothetical protein